MCHLGAWGINIDKMLPLGGNPQVLHKGEHVLAQVLVVLVDWGTVPWLVAYGGFADASKVRAEGVFPDDCQRGDCGNGLLGKRVSAGLGNFAEQVFAAKFLDIVSGATSVIGGIR